MNYSIIIWLRKRPNYYKQEGICNDSRLEAWVVLCLFSCYALVGCRSWISKQTAIAFFMEQPYEEIHIGHIIQETLKNQGRSVAWLARELNYTRENMYNIFKSPRIDTDTLLKISLALERNFFLLYVDFYKRRKEKITEM